MRVILLRSHGIEEAIDKRARKTFALGYANEALYGEYFLAGKSIQRDVLTESLVSDGISFVGHADYVETLPDGSRIVHECKAVSSTDRAWEIMKQEYYKVSNLAQCVRYMTAFKAHRGVLAYSGYSYGWTRSRADADGRELEKQRFVSPEMDKFYQVHLTPSGDIVVDGGRSGFTVYDQYAHLKRAVEILAKQVVEPTRPNPYWDHAKPSCDYCPFKVVCNKFDKNPTSTDEFLDRCRERVSKPGSEE